MSKARTLADFVSSGNPLADGTVDVSDISGVTATTAELNYTDGVTGNIQTQLDNKAPSANPTFTGVLTYNTLNDGTTSLTSTVAELNYVDGVTSNIQTQLDNIVTDLVSDTTPQLGGNLDLNSNDITGTGNVNVTGTVTATSFSGDGSGLSGVSPYDTGANSTGYFDLPAGTTAQRPASPAVGMMRYNTTESEYEVYLGAEWGPMITGNYPYEVEYLVIAGGAGGHDSSTPGNASAFHTITTVGGGKSGTNYSGGPGGSGGGANFLGGSGGAGTAGQGTDGGDNPSGSWGGGGGGGAGQAGFNSTGTTGAKGGDGLQSSINGTATYRAGGGGGTGRSTSGGAGGLGGGGNGGNNGGGASGTVNSGSGAGNSGGAGGYRCSVSGESSGGNSTAESPLTLIGGTAYTVTVGAGGSGSGTGGSGIVILRYAGTSQKGTGGTVSYIGSGASAYVVHTFTSSGTYVA